MLLPAGPAYSGKKDDAALFPTVAVDRLDAYPEIPSPYHKVAGGIGAVAPAQPAQHPPERLYPAETDCLRYGTENRVPAALPVRRQ